MPEKEPPTKTNSGCTIDLIVALAANGLTLSNEIDKVTSGNYNDTPLS